MCTQGRSRFIDHFYFIIFLCVCACACAWAAASHQGKGISMRFPAYFLAVLALGLDLPTPQARWVDTTSTYFEPLPEGLRVTSLADLNNQNRVGFIGTWVNRSGLVWYCSDENWGKQYRLCWRSTEFPEAIVSTVVADMNRDGALDILVQGEKGTLYFVDGNHRNSSASKIDVGVNLSYDSSVPQISVVNVKGNCGFPDIALVETDGSLVVLSATTETSNGLACIGEGIPTFVRTVLVEGDRGVREVVPLSIMSEDIDGDCVADLLYVIHDIGANSLQVFAYFPRSAKHQLLMKLSNANQYGYPSAADMNGDGAPDIVFPLCRTKKDSTTFGVCSQFDGIAIFYNNLMKTPPCRTDVCCTGHPFGFSESPSAEFFLQDSANCGLHVGSDFPLFMPNSKESPLILRPGDSSRNGYTDLLVPSTYGPLLIESRIASHGIFFNCIPVNEEFADSVKAGPSPYGSATPFFATVSDKGKLDVVLTYHGGKVAPPTLYVRYMPLLEQNYFLTGSALNGAIKGDLWGLYQPLTVHRFGWNDIAMNKRWAYGTQLSRSQGHALQSPQLFFGLGRTFSYVQEYTAGIFIGKNSMYRRWPANLVPNSHVFTQMHPLRSVDKWKLQLYLAFATYKELLLIVLGTVLTVVGLLIAFLRWEELKQDQRELKLR
uniref:Uncharacterized protein TCIL3000_11_12350 n=1 Tax=Trypanosoma congolense (strain IL3000) TaxID=1068625 RepID=G0V270_TRYCI|nr:unnamed protein product [Trypanosoma congolense IL3000]